MDWTWLKLAIAGALAVGACAEPGLEGEPPVTAASEAALVPPDRYEGQAMCRTLVRAAGVEPISRCPVGPGDYGDLQLPGQAVCLRDAYVFTAIAYCWRSECLDRQGVTDEDVRAGRAASTPAEESRWARRMLEDASRLCGRTPVEPDTCSTSNIVACPR